MKQSLISKIVTSVLCFACHSKYEKSATRSNTLANKSNNKKSYFYPIGFRTERVKCGECYLEKITPNKNVSKRVIFHIHGGSFKVKLTDFYRRESVYYSRLFNNATVYNVDYRVFPDVKFPIPLDDVYNCYLSVLKNENANDIVVIGDSCGANMAVSLCMKLRDTAKLLPNSVVLFSFWGDLSNSGWSYKENCYRDPFYGVPKRISYEEAKDKIHRITLYAQGEDLYNPYLSPCFGSYANFPRTIFVSGSADLSQSDSFTAYEKLKKISLRKKE